MLIEMDGISRIVGWYNKGLPLWSRTFPVRGRHREARTLAKVVLGWNCLITGGLCESISLVELGPMSRMALSVSNAKILSHEISVTFRIVATVNSLRGVYSEC